MAAEHWFRWHHGCVTDPKWRVVASRCVTNVTVGHVVAVWAAMMENASQATPRGQLQGWCDEDIAALLGFTEEQVRGIREAMQGKTLAGNELAAWEKRQPKREDSSAERNRRYRERKALQGDEEERSVTQRDAEEVAETLETETETEKKKQKQKRGAAAPRAADAMFPEADPIHLRDWLAVRAKKRLPLTETAAKGFRREAERAGLTVADAIKRCAERGWAGLSADWDGVRNGSANGYVPLPGER